jgi:hypothetical protein
MSSPKPLNSNFWYKCNPQRYTRPCTHIYIRYPKMKRCYCLFPKKSNRNKPNTKCCRLSWSISCSFTKPFNMRQRCFTNFPINKTNTLKSKTTSKCTLQKIFYSCFKRKRIFRILSTKYNQRKTLLLYTKIHSYLICSYNKLITSCCCQKCLINILTLANTCNFLPRKRYSKNKRSSEKQNSSSSCSISIFLKRPSLKNIMLR